MISARGKQIPKFEATLDENGEKPQTPLGHFADGDWLCPTCGDHCFKKTVVCRSCGTPKSFAGMGGKAMGGEGIAMNPFFAMTQAWGASNEKPGDWMCPSCGDLQFARNAECRKCATPKPVVSSNGQAAKVGDWICPSCQDVQFAKNTECRKCGTPKPDDADSQIPRGVGSPNGQVGQPGDWICPNEDCKDVQFAKNSLCRKCGTGKPMDADLHFKGARVAPKGLGKGFGKAAPPMIGMMQMFGYGGYPVMKGFGKATSNGQRFKPGDWICPSCGDMQFEKNAACRKCNTPKPAGRTSPYW